MLVDDDDDGCTKNALLLLLLFVICFETRNRIKTYTRIILVDCPNHTISLSSNVTVLDVEFTTFFLHFTPEIEQERWMWNTTICKTIHCETTYTKSEGTKTKKILVVLLLMCSMVDVRTYVQRVCKLHHSQK